MKRKYITIFAILGLIIFFAIETQGDEDCDKLKEGVEVFKQIGLIMGIKNNYIQWQVNPTFWGRIAYEEKKTLAWAWSKYSQCNGGGDSIFIVDGYSGKRLVFYGPMGYKVEE